MKVAVLDDIYQEKILIIVLMILTMVTMIFAQITQSPEILWSKTYGGIFDDFGNSVEQTSDGGYIIAGSFGPAVYLIKVSELGGSQWTRTYTGLDSRGFAVQQTADGGYIITGGALPVSARAGDDVYLIKTDSLGLVSWTRTYSGPGEYRDCGYSVEQTADGGYIIAGLLGTGTSGSQVYLIKTDSIGDTTWTRSFGESEDDCGYEVHGIANGGYIITGSVEVNAADYLADVYLIKTDALGGLVWSKYYGGSYDEVGYSVKATDNGGYIITGYTVSFAQFGGGDIYLLKTDDSGDTAWTRTYGAADEDFGYSVEQTSDGGYIIAGSIMSPSSLSDSADVYLIKTDVKGDIVWTADYGGPAVDRGYSIQITSDGGYIIAGYTRSFGSGGSDVYVIKTKPLIALLSPNGGEFLQGGADYKISWSPENEISGDYFFRILMSRDGGVVYADTVADGISHDDNIYNWEIPRINCGCCRMMVELIDAQGNVIGAAVGDSDFTIDCDPPQIDSTTVWSNTSYGGPFEVVTKVADNLAGIEDVLLYYRRSEDLDWISVVMKPLGGAVLVESIPAAGHMVDSVRYYIRARDLAQNCSTDPINAPGACYAFVVDLTGIIEHDLGPTGFQFSLMNNPILGPAAFKLVLGKTEFVRLRIYDCTGRLVCEPINQRMASGQYQLLWDGEVSAGVYFYRFCVSDYEAVGKMVVLR